MTLKKQKHEQHLPQALACSLAGKHLKAPSLLANFTEVRTAPLVLGTLLKWRKLSVDVDGQQRPVLLIPGFQAWEWSMEPLRRFLCQHNFAAVHWGLGRNHGDVAQLMPQVSEKVKQYAKQRLGSVALVGWSLGGYLARETARDLPEHVDEVITFGTGAWGGPKYTFAAPYYKLKGLSVDELEERTFERFQKPLRQPVTAFYSKSDGIVNWECCIDQWSPQVTHIEVDCPHMGMPLDSHIITRVTEILGH